MVLLRVLISYHRRVSLRLVLNKIPVRPIDREVLPLIWLLELIGHWKAPVRSEIQNVKQPGNMTVVDYLGVDEYRLWLNRVRKLLIIIYYSLKSERSLCFRSQFNVWSVEGDKNIWSLEVIIMPFTYPLDSFLEKNILFYPSKILLPSYY